MTTLDPVASRLGGIETRLDKLEMDIAGLRGEWRVVKWVLTAFVAPTCITLIAWDLLPHPLACVRVPASLHGSHEAEVSRGFFTASRRQGSSGII